MRRLESGTAGRRSAGDAALQVPGPRPADPEGAPASAVRRPRARSRTPRSRTAVGTRPEAIGPPATGSLTETLLTEFAPETSRKARPDCRQDAAMARRTAPRIRKWIRALKDWLRRSARHPPRLLPARTRLKARTEFPAARTMEHLRNAGRRGGHKAQGDHRRYQAADNRRPLQLPLSHGRTACARPRELPATKLPAGTPLPRPDVSARRGTGVASVARMERPLLPASLQLLIDLGDEAVRALVGAARGFRVDRPPSPSPPAPPAPSSPARSSAAPFPCTARIISL